MSDYIKRDDVKSALNGACVLYHTETIDRIPSADVVEVVRCKDCKYYHPSDNVEDITCEFGRRVGDYDYCSYGERKEQEHEITKR